jgi:hypothetical protein
MAPLQPENCTLIWNACVRYDLIVEAVDLTTIIIKISGNTVVHQK